LLGQPQGEPPDQRAIRTVTGALLEAADPVAVLEGRAGDGAVRLLRFGPQGSGSGPEAAAVGGALPAERADGVDLDLAAGAQAGAAVVTGGDGGAVGVLLAGAGGDLRVHGFLRPPSCARSGLRSRAEGHPAWATPVTGGDRRRSAGEHLGL